MVGLPFWRLGVFFGWWVGKKLLFFILSRAFEELGFGFYGPFLGGGLKNRFLFSPRKGEMIQFDSYLSKGLVQPPTSFCLWHKKKTC